MGYDGKAFKKDKMQEYTPRETIKDIAKYPFVAKLVVSDFKKFVVEDMRPRSQKIIDGMKIIVCKLKPNPLNFTSIAYPVDELRLPQWFIDLPFDDEAMEQTLVDEKIDNLLGVLNWDIRSNTDVKSTFDDLFSFG